MARYRDRRSGQGCERIVEGLEETEEETEVSPGERQVDITVDSSGHSERKWR